MFLKYILSHKYNSLVFLFVYHNYVFYSTFMYFMCINYSLNFYFTSCNFLVTLCTFNLLTTLQDNFLFCILLMYMKSNFVSKISLVHPFEWVPTKSKYIQSFKKFKIVHPILHSLELT